MPEADALRSLRGFDNVIFDCDSTLSRIEGIDELARMKDCSEEVAALTEAAMAGDVPLEGVYGRRLAMLTPTETEVAALEAAYRANVVGDAREVIQALWAVGKEVFIVSGGLAPAVEPFGEWLGIPATNIRAVPLADAANALLARSDGKPVVITELLRGRHGRTLLVGDGASDLEAYDAVDLFVGYTGAVARPRVVEESDVLITGDSLAPVLGVALTRPEEVDLLDSEHAGVVVESRARIESGELRIRRGDRL